MNTKQKASELRRRIDRHRAFLERREPGDLLVCAGLGYHSLEGFLCTRLYERGPDAVLAPAAVEPMVKEYVDLLRASCGPLCETNDDTIPGALVYWGIGCITAAMTGLTPVHDGTTSWLEPNMAWPDIDRLTFNPDNQWIQFAVRINQALWKYWEEDFAVLPYLHRSPLDAANGIRGTELFAEMYEQPERVKRLIDWCADWMISLEKLIAREAPRPKGFGVSVWNCWLPDDAVFVNGDPVGLISRAAAEEFDRPYNEKLFTNTGGGFFHNHTIGLYQADLVGSYRGIKIQWFVDDPRQPSLQTALLDMPEMREKLLASSLQCPIGGWFSYDRIDPLLDVVRHGRFILAIGCPEGVTPQQIVRKVRAVSNLR